MPEEPKSAYIRNSPTSKKNSTQRGGKNTPPKNQNPKRVCSEKMNSEEVAELANAINNHAEVLYESWKKGQEAINMKRIDDTLELLADPGLTPKLEHLVSNFVRRDKAKRQHFQQNPFDNDGQAQQQHRESSPSGQKKALPKSILAAVQRFEPQQNQKEIIHGIHSPRERSPAVGEGIVRYHIPGVGPITKSVLWAETINKQNNTTSSERIGDRSSPIPTPVNINNYLDPNTVNNNSNNSNGVIKSVISPSTGKIVRERHIPIERVDDNDSPRNSPRLTSPTARFSPVRTVQIKVSPNNDNNIQALEQEEERLLRALQTGHVLIPTKFNPGGNGSIPPREKLSSNEISHNNHSSRIEYAKERIRQSQENPLTQQRLELQKKLPFPSGSLAAAIALQQGKLKFQTQINGNNHHDEVANEINGHQHQHGHHRETGRNSFVRFGAGATVADRVQLFEKYPTHISPPPLVHSKSPSPGRTQGHVITHPIHIQHSNNSEPHSQQYQINHSSQRPREGQLVAQKSQYSPSVINNSNNNFNANVSTAPWRTSPARDLHTNTLVSSQHLQPSDPNIISNSSPTRKQAALSHVSSVTPLKVGGDIRLQSRKDVPKFYFPEGKHIPSTNFIQESLSKAEEKLKQLNNCLNYSKFGELLVACGISLYWKLPFWMALGLAPDATCSSKIFLAFLKYLLSECPDDASRFARIISSASINFPDGYGSKNKTNFNNNNVPMNIKYYINHGNYCLDLKCVEIGMSDFVPMIQDIIDTHPGLGFLRDAPEFHSRYITTVISRIFYKVNRSWSGKLTIAEIRRSNLLRILKRLEEETDINVITEYFSYEHFYVIYCKFWELDKDHDLLIDKHDLAAHADHALSSRIIDRIFSGTVLRGWDVANPSRATHDKMTYSDFVWFLLSEEDKKTPTAVEYWFRCIDLDGDGIISPYELQYFYSEQESRIESLGIEPLHFSNVYCQIVDMLHCSPTGIRLRDLKKNLYLAANVFNTVFNLDKYLEHEQRDPFAAAASLGHPESAEGESDWDKYAAAEYELLIAEENPEHLQDSGLDEEALTPS